MQRIKFSEQSPPVNPTVPRVPERPICPIALLAGGGCPCQGLRRPGPGREHQLGG